MSMWKEKKEQQAIFNGLADGILIHESGPPGLSLPKERRLFAQKIANYIKKVRNGSVIIDAGCGKGTLLNEINCHVPNIYYMIGIDISSESLKVAKQKNEDADFIVCDIDALPLRDKVAHMIIMENVLHHLPTLDSLSNLIPLLNSSGFMLIDEKIRGNPLQDILTLAYPLIPYSFKMVLREKDNHIDRYGHLPPIKPYSPKAFLKFIKQYSNRLTVVEVKYHDFFLFLRVLEYLSYVFPRILSIQIPIHKLYFLEQRAILRWSAVGMTVVLESI